MMCVCFSLLSMVCAGMEQLARRWAGAADEPLEVRAPLMGLFSSMPEPASLEESVHALLQDAAANLHFLDPEELRSNIDMATDFAHSRMAAGDASMPWHHMAALVLFTS